MISLFVSAKGNRLHFMCVREFQILFESGLCCIYSSNALRTVISYHASIGV